MGETDNTLTEDELKNDIVKENSYSQDVVNSENKDEEKESDAIVDEFEQKLKIKIAKQQERIKKAEAKLNENKTKLKQQQIAKRQQKVDELGNWILREFGESVTLNKFIKTLEKLGYEQKQR